MWEFRHFPAPDTTQKHRSAARDSRLELGRAGLEGGAALDAHGAGQSALAVEQIVAGDPGEPDLDRALGQADHQRRGDRGVDP